MSVFELVKSTIIFLKCLKGNWSWMHSQQLETRPIKIKPELEFSKTKLDPPKQILIVASTLLGLLLGHWPPVGLQLFILLEETMTSVVWALPPELCGRCRVVGVDGNYWLHSCYPWGKLPFLLRSHFQWSQISCVYIYLLPRKKNQQIFGVG